ncbi:hypothetical protein GCM10022291_12750 [Postechiella marina]|uniref:Uncharacterized protein n=1 Tax=Postechiella marina TaxID=943941 RepID=A0ABP8C5T6_9FLAO
MKHLIYLSKITLLAFLFLTFSSCSSDDDSAKVDLPTINYSNIVLDATFFEAGNSLTPTINWNGNTGSISLGSPITGLNINTSGTLSWTKDLPIGTHNVEVIVANSSGQIVENITINNPFQGIFTGTYDNSHFFELEFITDGTLLIRAHSVTNPDFATGTWIMDGTTITTDYAYNSGSELSLSGSLVTGANATYSGNWYTGHGTLSDNEGGTFLVILN